MADIYNILVANDYTNGEGEKKTEWIRVGTAFENKQNGFNCELPPGIGLTGRFVILPRKDRA